MKRLRLIYIIWYIAISIAIAIYTYLFIQPLAQYAEGWNTFYYDQTFVSLTLESKGIGSLVGSFLLQFFYHPWHGVAIVTVLCLCLFALLHVIIEGSLKAVKKSYVKTVAVILVHAAALAAVSTIIRSHLAYDPMFAQLSNMTRFGQWDKVIDTCKEKSPVSNLLYQNYLNMALAETNELGDKLLDEPVVDIRSIYVNEVQGQEVAALLSDVYYSMGHIAQSQMYAFEANEKVDNLSPRMLQRLVITNILYGEYAVARKYLFWLSKTIYYKPWAEQYLSMINNGTIAKDKTISAKHLCIFPDNRFSGIKGIDDDLLNIARNTRGTQQCKVTLQYLGSLYILAGYKDQFLNMVNEFSGSQDLPTPLPKCFQSYYNHLTKQ